MSDPIEPPWLARYATGDLKPWLREVHAFHGWSIATDARTLVAVRDGGIQRWNRGLTSEPSPDVAVTSITPIVEGVMLDAVTTTLDALRTYCGDVVMTPCDVCNGDGLERTDSSNPQVIPDSVCGACDGARQLLLLLDGPEAKAIMSGLIIDCNRLAWALAPELMSGEIKVGRLVVHGVTDVLIVDGADWRIVQCQLASESMRGMNLPRWHPDPLYAELWASRNDPAGRAALIDWLTERGDSYADHLRDGVTV